MGKDSFDRGREHEIHALARLYRKGTVTYRYISTRIPRLYATGIKGQARSRVRALASDFIRESKHRLFPYSERLVSLMEHRGYFTVAVSGSPIEVVSPLRSLGFARILGSSMEVRRGAYTGRVEQNLIIAEAKKRAIDSLARQHHLDLENSFAFGDTEQDLPLLRAVGNPVPVNPNPALRTLAARNGWRIPRQVLREVAARVTAG